MSRKPLKKDQLVPTAAKPKPCPRPGRKVMTGHADDCVPISNFPDPPALPELAEVADVSC